MEQIHLFLTKVTEELLYNVVHDEEEISYRDLSDDFEIKTGYRPMDFFGFGNISGSGWFDFIKGIPGVQGKKKVTIRSYSDENRSTKQSTVASNFTNGTPFFPPLITPFTTMTTSHSPSPMLRPNVPRFIVTPMARPNLPCLETTSYASYDYENSTDESNSSDCEEEVVYKLFNTTHLEGDLTGISTPTVAKYREAILIKCCEILKDQFVNKKCSKDVNGNTPLHLVAALPGITFGCETLVKYLLKAGVDPLATNNKRQTFLHIIFGRFKVGHVALRLKDERLHKTKWFAQDRIKLLELLSQELSQTLMPLLANARDINGNTVLHEYALSTTAEEFVDEEIICNNLMKFGAELGVTNNSGNVPLHYAFNPKLFETFLQNGAVCRARNDRDESPFLSIVKMSVNLPFAETSAIKEMQDQALKITTKIAVNRSPFQAFNLLENLNRIISNNENVKKAAWLADVEGNVAIDIVLIAIRIAGSYDLPYRSPYYVTMPSSFLKLLKEILRNATPQDIKRTNTKGQNFLHVLLNTDGNKIIDEKYILESIKILLEQGVDVNAVDLEGCTPLDIVYKHHLKQPEFFKKCSDLLTKNGASRSPRQTSKMSTLRIRDETRKVRSCPKRHLGKAKRLTDSNTNVTLVEKYRYSNQDLIGTGAFSSVFVAIKDENVDSKSGAIECRAYALKRIEKAKLNDEEIRREIKTLLSFCDKCQNIIKCYEAFEDNNFQYICLDLMDADLQEFVTNNDVNKVLKSNPAKQVEMIKGIINGLAFLHEQKFIHRDLKPGNILYTTDPDLHFKITDFGLTKNTSSSSMSSTAASGVAMAPGTRCWMAPELVSLKQKEHTQQSDVFSLGLVVHYLLTLGKHPFVNENEEPAHVIERKITGNPPNFDRNLSPEAKSFLQILLNKVSSKRPPASYLNQHPYLWSDRKKIEFLKAVGDQPEAEKPLKDYPNSDLEKRLQTTGTGQIVDLIPWNRNIGKLYEEMVSAWKWKTYRTDKVIDLIRFIRNAYAHKQDRSLLTKHQLDKNIFFLLYPSLVLDVFGVVQQLGFDEKRSSIRDALNI